MNKIINIETSVIKTPLKRTFITAVRSTNHIDTIIVKLTLDNGTIGIGAAPATTAITGDTIAGMVFIINELFAPVIISSELSDYEQVLKLAFCRASFNTGAKMAVDLAFHDLLAKMYCKYGQQGISVAKYLGAKSNVLETDVSISCGPIKDTIANIRNGVELGFNAIKVKTGADFTRDIELLKHIEKEFSTATKFRFDANQGWTEMQTRQFIEELNKYSINTELVEQPVKSYDVKAMKSITQFSNIPILADESVFSVADAERLINEEACNMFNIKLAKTGGILEAKKIKAVADNAGFTCMIGCMAEAPVGMVAATSFALAENITIADLDFLDWVDSSYHGDSVYFDTPNIVLKDSVKGFGFVF
jgi:L-alanine-DL-glutamate epimerase-like enolase superfamily enzyme